MCVPRLCFSVLRCLVAAANNSDRHCNEKIIYSAGPCCLMFPENGDST